MSEIMEQKEVSKLSNGEKVYFKKINNLDFEIFNNDEKGEYRIVGNVVNYNEYEETLSNMKEKIEIIIEKNKSKEFENIKDYNYMFQNEIIKEKNEKVNVVLLKWKDKDYTLLNTFNGEVIFYIDDCGNKLLVKNNNNLNIEEGMRALKNAEFMYKNGLSKDMSEVERLEESMDMIEDKVILTKISDYENWLKKPKEMEARGYEVNIGKKFADKYKEKYGIRDEIELFRFKEKETPFFVGSLRKFKCYDQIEEKYVLERETLKTKGVQYEAWKFDKNFKLSSAIEFVSQFDEWFKKKKENKKEEKMARKSGGRK